MSTKQTLRITTTAIDEWSRQHYRGCDSDRDYCDVDGQIHTFHEEPEYPISESVKIIEVDKSGQTVKIWQEGQQ